MSEMDYKNVARQPGLSLSYVVFGLLAIVGISSIPQKFLLKNQHFLTVKLPCF